MKNKIPSGIQTAIEEAIASGKGKTVSYLDGKYIKIKIVKVRRPRGGRDIGKR